MAAWFCLGLLGDKRGFSSHPHSALNEDEGETESFAEQEFKMSTSEPQPPG